MVIGAGPAGLEAARVLGERGHRVVVLEANDAAGGQIRLAASSQRRRDLIGIVDWRLAECKHHDVDIRFNTYAEADDVLAEEPDLVIVATGGVPNTEFLTEGSHLVSDGWDVLSGSFRAKGDVLLYDDNGQHPGLDAAEVLARAGASIEFVTPERMLAPDVGGVNYPGYFKVFAEHDVRVTLNERLTAVRRKDGRLEVDLYNEYAHVTRQRTVDQVVVEHGTLPSDELYFALVPGSSNLGEVDQQALLDLRPQEVRRNPTAAISCSASEMRWPAATFTPRCTTHSGCAWRCERLEHLLDLVLEFADVPLGEFAGALRVAIEDGSQNADLAVHVVLQVRQPLTGQVPDPQRQIQGLGKGVEEIFVVRQPVHRPMRCGVQFEQSAWRTVTFEFVEQPTQLLALVVAGLAGGSLGGQALQPLTNVTQRREIGYVDLRRVTSAARVHDDESLVGQPLDRLAHRRATEPEFGGELDLVDGVARRDVEVHQLVADRLVRQIRQQLAACGLLTRHTSRCRHPSTPSNPYRH